MEQFCDVLFTQAPFLKNDAFLNLAKRCSGWTNARYSAFEKCGFYDGDVRHGGPNPDVEYKQTTNNHWGEDNEKLNPFDPKSNTNPYRRRRSAEDCSNWDGEKTHI